MLGAKLLYNIYNSTPKKGGFSFIPYSNEYNHDDIVVVDCTHPSLPTFSHHRGHRNPAGLKPSDTSTGTTHLRLLSLKPMHSYWQASTSLGMHDTSDV